jgi:UDP-GlcNAc:undecaprenyl-phosphate GlcNAc-1-phosphate transferase
MIWLAIAFGFTFLAGLVLIAQASRWGFVDLPEERKVHLVPTPRTGGLAMICGTSATFALYLGLGHPWAPIPWQTIGAAFGFLALGALDDRYGFHPRRKLLWFALLALLAAWPWAFGGPAGSPYLIHLGGWMLQAPRWVAYPVLAIWFLAVPNAVNIEDAINGYMGGFTLILLAFTAARGVQVQMVMGALLGFLILNWPRAKHFMGDAGSFGCGFFIAEAILRAGGDRHPGLALTLTAPIALDVLMGVIRRRRRGQSLFVADRLTLPHHLLNLTGTATRATPILWGVTLLFGLSVGQPWRLGIMVVAFVLILITCNRQFLFGRSVEGAR